MFNFTTVVFDGTSPPFISQTLRDGTPQVAFQRVHQLIQGRASSVGFLETGVETFH